MFTGRCSVLICSLVISLQSTTAIAAPIDRYLDRLAEHPQVNQLLAQSSHFRELADGELGLPDPQFIIGVDNLPIENPSFDRFLPTSKVLGFRQQFPNRSLLRARSHKQRTMSKHQQLLADYTLKRLRSILIKQLYELHRVESLHANTLKQLELYQLVEEDLNGQLEAGQSVYGRLSEIDVERAEIEQQLNDLQVEKIAAVQELIQLVGEVPAIELPAVPEARWSQNTAELFPVQIASIAMAVAGEDVNAAKAAFGPNFSIQALYKQRESGEGFAGDDWFSVQATVTLPLWRASNQRPKLRAAQAGQRSAEFAYDDTKREWLKRMAVLKSEIEIARSNIEILEAKGASRTEMVNAVNRNYESGNERLGTVLKAQIDELTIDSQLIRQRTRLARLSVEFNSHIMGGHHETN